MYSWSGSSAGTWDTSDASWGGTGANALWNAANGPANVANFNTAALNATVNGTVYTNGIIFNQAGTLSSGTINLAGTMPTITANANATIVSALAGSGGLTMAGSGMLALGGVANYSGPTVISGGTLQLTFQPGEFSAPIAATAAEL